MQPTTYDTETELSSVNAILASIGQSPITTLNFENPEISFAYKLLMEACTDVQNEGWVYNTEENYPFTPEPSTKRIRFPENVLRLDISENSVYRTSDVIRRNGYLYDKMRHSYEFDKEVKADVVWKFEYEDLPSVFKRYITSKASSRAATQMVANPQLTQLLSSQEAFARAACVEYECNQGDYTFFGTPDGTSYRSYQPYRTLNR